MTATIEPVPAGTPSVTPLPYSPQIDAVLGPMHVAFRALSGGLSVPLISAGLGSLFSNPLTGSQLVLRTTGRRSGRRRAVALGYTIHDGAVYMAAGWGATTHWYMNLVADPHVEVVLPGGTAYAGVAETVTESVELVRAWRRLLTDLGVIGRGFVTDPRTASDALLVEKTTGIPLVRIRPTGIAAGPSDPGGLGWIALQAVMLGIAAAALRRVVRGARPAAS